MHSSILYYSIHHTCHPRGIKMHSNSNSNSNSNNTMPSQIIQHIFESFLFVDIFNSSNIERRHASFSLDLFLFSHKEQALSCCLQFSPIITYCQSVTCNMCFNLFLFVLMMYVISAKRRRNRKGLTEVSVLGVA